MKWDKLVANYLVSRLPRLKNPRVKRKKIKDIKELSYRLYSIIRH